MTTEELFGRCVELAKSEPGVVANRFMHETLVLSSREVWMQDVRALALFISAVCQADVPDELLRLIPHHQSLAEAAPSVDLRYRRCIVGRWDENTIDAETADGGRVEIDYTEHPYLRKILREGMQLNLLDSHVEGEKLQPAIVVVEPDFLLDVSTVARCFQGSYGHHPLLYTALRLKEREGSQAMLLGNFAGAALDDIINHVEMPDTISSFFREQAMQFVTCEGFNGRQFMADAQQQWTNIGEAVDVLFGEEYDRRKALLEPSFVCESLGLQGRVDLMTSDMRLLVEQKSGKNYQIERSDERSAFNVQRSTFKEEHYVQLLLYYGILRYNFGRSANQVDIRLLYSRYPATRGLLYVNFYRELFREAIRLRNQIVATELLIAREGFGRILPLLQPAVVFKEARKDDFYYRYVEPPVAKVASLLSRLSPLERAYYERMLTFVYREQLIGKVGRQEGQGGAASDLWNMPLAEKMETGNIILGDEPSATLNFRRGDMVYVYNYDDVPDARRAILYKGTIAQIDGEGVKVKLSDEQQNVDPMKQGKWAVEHAGSDMNTTSAIKSLHQFIAASAGKKSLLLGSRPPQADTSLRLSRSYHPHYDDIVLRAKQSLDYFLLVGPAHLLLLSYTNRAVDEICAMLEDAGHDYIRIGNDTSCDPRFAGHLLENTLGEKPKLDAIRQRIEAMPIIVGTTSMLQARPFIFQLKHFSLCIVDEASQILEPGLVGLLASDRIGRFILIGDHKQLPAVVQQSEEESRVDDPLLTAIGITDCRQSLFERLLKWEHSQGRTQFTGILRKQGRMHPDIAAFPNEMFYPNERLEPVPLAHQTDTSLHYDLPSEDAIDEVLKQRRVVFIDAGTHETFSDKTNPAEARIVADLLRRIYRFYGDRFDAARTVGVIVPYRNQIAMIRHEIEQLQLPRLEQISIDTVERYQGSQRDVIIYSFTVSRPYQLDFLTSNCFKEGSRTIDRKLNVAITRARKQMLMTGNKEILCRNVIFSELIARYQEKIY